jgi:hypothetical protein
MIRFISKCIQTAALAMMICLGLYLFKLCASIVDKMELLILSNVTLLAMLKILGWLSLFGLIVLVAIMIIMFGASLFSYVWTDFYDDDDENQGE